MKIVLLGERPISWNNFYSAGFANQIKKLSIAAIDEFEI